MGSMVSNLECISQLKGSMNALGAPLDGEAIGYPDGGSLTSGPYGVYDEGSVSPVMCECSHTRASGDHGKMWQGTLKGVASI